MNLQKIKQISINTIKVVVAAIAAILVANLLHLEFAVSTGIVWNPPNDEKSSSSQRSSRI